VKPRVGLLPGSPGTWRQEGDPPDAYCHGDVDAAYDFAGDFYDYFLRAFGRESIDDMCHSLELSVNEVSNNAWWSPTFEDTSYGIGMASDDVVAHEFAHGLTEMTADLIYQNESGALNESYSDIFGELVDLFNGDAAFAGAPGGPAWPTHPSGSGTDTPNNLRTACSPDGVRWLMGEDTRIGAIRDMWDPTCMGDPGRFTDKDCLERVHTNSGIPNHAFAMLVDGKTFNSHTVTGIGPIKAAAVWFRALTVYLTPASDFEAAVVALTQAAADLIDTSVSDPRPGGTPVTFTLSDSLQVLTALQAVEMDLSTNPCFIVGACCDPAVPACTLTDVLGCSGEYTGGESCATLSPTCGTPGAASAMLLLLDRSESMEVVRPGGSTRCADALAAAMADVSAFAAGHPARTISVWTFQGDTSTELTAGFVDEAAALAALDTLDGVACTGTSPLAEAICAAADEFGAALPATDRVLAISTAGVEDASDGECAGPDSTTGPPPAGNYDPGSWQEAVYSKLQGEVVSLVRNWEIFDQIGPTGNGPFLEDIAGSTAGNYAPVDDGDPAPAAFPDLGSSAALVPSLSVRGVAALAVIFAAIGGLVLARRRSGKRVA
jgi:hypothetical protein